MPHKTAAVLKAEAMAEEAAAAAAELKISPKSVTVDLEGFASRKIQVHMPKNMVPDHLRDPRVWSRVQQSAQHSLRKYDEVTIFSFDESSMVTAIVSKAEATEAHLVILRVGSFAEVTEKLYSDDVFEVYWTGRSYGVRRKADGVNMTTATYQNERLAIGALQRLYAKVQA